MERVNQIWRHPVYQECLHQIEELEESRSFCRHDSTHFLDVARLAYLENLELQKGISKEWIYACGLLHDIGRHLQYEKGIPHHEASAILAEGILKDCGFNWEEIEEIKKAILAHRYEKAREDGGLAGLLYRADKQSRNCFACKSERECNWDAAKKNMQLLR